MYSSKKETAAGKTPTAVLFYAIASWINVIASCKTKTSCRINAFASCPNSISSKINAIARG